MNIDISTADESKTVNVGEPSSSGGLFSIQKPAPTKRAIPLSGGHPPPLTRPNPPTRNEATELLDGFANPMKTDAGAPFTGMPTGSESESDSMSDDSGNDLTEGSVDPSEEYVVDEGASEDLPSPGFASLDDEKSHILWKLSRAKRSGMPVHRNLSIDSSIRELRNELKRVEYELGLSQSLRFQKRMLCLAVSGLEVVTERYSVFDLQLKGWSSQVQDDIDSFDQVLTRIHEKYKDRASMAPELQLLLMLISSAVSFHVTRSMMKSISQPGGGGLGQLLQSMMGAPKQPPTTNVEEVPPSPSPSVPVRTPMRGPNAGIPNMMGGIPAPLAPPQISARTSTKRPREDDDEEDRVSDVVTDDDDSSSGRASSDDDSQGELQIQTVPTAGRGRGRARGGARGRGGQRTVVTL